MTAERMSGKKVIRRIGDLVERDPHPIGYFVEEIGGDWNTVSSYLNALREGGFLKCVEKGRRKLYWRPMTSDRQVGLKLRHIAKHIEEAEYVKAHMKTDELIDRSIDPITPENVRPDNSR